MKTIRNKVYIIELLLVFVLVLCTLFPILNNNYIILTILFMISILIHNKVKYNKQVLNNEKKVIKVIVLANTIYIALFYMLGLYTGYYKSSGIFSIKSIFYYIIPITLIIILEEYIRKSLLSVNTSKSKVLVLIITTLIDCSIYMNLYNKNNLDSFLAFIGLVLFSAIANNLFGNYLALKYDYKPAIIYKCMIVLFVYIFPIVPNVYPFFRAFVKMVYPLLLYMYIDKYYNLDKVSEARKINKKQIVSFGVGACMAMLVIALISCRFTYGVVVIGSNSMSKAINKGDIILFKNTKNVVKNDVIIFNKDDIRVVHRIIDIRYANKEYRYYTKGDANKIADEGFVSKENLLGKAIFKIKYLGMPTLWLRNIFK